MFGDLQRSRLFRKQLLRSFVGPVTPIVNAYLNGSSIGFRFVCTYPYSRIYGRKALEAYTAARGLGMIGAQRKT